MPSRSGRSWLDISIKTEAKEFDSVRSKIMGWPEEVLKDVYWPQIQEIGRDGAEFMKEIIGSTENNTPTGEARGQDGRVKSGLMRDSVASRARERVKGYSLFVGWITGKPGYSIFQEQGTKNGIVAMNAVGQTQEYMLYRLKALKGKHVGSNGGTE